MPRFQGLRRAYLLVASAFPLLANVSDTSDNYSHSYHPHAATEPPPPIVEEQQEQLQQQVDENSWTTTAAQRIMEDESLTTLPALTEWPDTTEFGHHYNVVVPFRPHYAPLLVEGRRQRHGNQTQQSRSSWEDKIAETYEDNKEELSASVSVNETAATATNDTAVEEEEADAHPEAVPPDANNSTETATTEETDINDNTDAEKVGAQDESDDETVKSVKFDYASKSAGALILEKSAGWKGASSLLTSDNDRYAIIPCAETSKSVVISLSEDILVKNVVLANYERFSSTVKDFQLLGSQTMGKWVDLGTYTAKQGGGKQEFELYEHSWARYLKIRVLSHYGNEHFLTISQISVFGDTMLQGFHEHWEEEQEQEALLENEEKAEEAETSFETYATEMVGDEKASSESDGVTPADEGSANPIEITEFTSNDPCTTELDSMCPKDLNFEQLVFLVSTNQSQFERMSFLGSSTSCRSLSKYEHGDFPEIHVHSVAPVATIATESRETSHEAHVLSTDEASVHVNTADSAVISQIQNLIKTAAGIDVDLSKVNALFHGQEDNGDSNGEEAGAGHATEQAEQNVKAHTQNVKAADSQSKEGSSIPPEAKDHGRTSLIEEKEWAKLLNALEGIPSSACLKEIDFTDFRKRVASNKNNPAGAGNSHSTGGSVELQPIFKRLTDEIKTLQGTLGMQEDFLKKSMACYQKVLLELVVQQEEKQSRTDKRLEDLEHAINTYLMWLHFVENCIAAIIALLRSVLTKPWHNWFSTRMEDVPDTVVIVLIAITVLVSSRVLLFSGWRCLRRRLSSPKKDTIKKRIESAEDDDEKKVPGSAETPSSVK